MTSCGSSVATSKTGDNRSKSCETVCSNSSCFFKRRKPILPYSVKQPVTRTAANTVRQRVLSAKLQKLRSLQNQLNDANFHLSELSRENQALKTLQKRQDKALSKYEHSNADLPRLLHSHEEEIRTLTEKNKTLRKNLKETAELLKFKEEELATVKEQLKRLEKLNKDKRLTEREKLLEQVDDLQFKLSKSEEQVTQLNRRIMLETKNSKHRLNAEIMKHKQCQREVVQAMHEIDRLTRLLETRDQSPTKKNRFPRMPNRQAISLVNLENNGRSSIKSDSSTDLHSKAVTEVKLEPIKHKFTDENRKSSSILKIPSESIKSRLSSASSKTKEMSRNLIAKEELRKSDSSHTFYELCKDIDDVKKSMEDSETTSNPEEKDQDTSNDFVIEDNKSNESEVLSNEEINNVETCSNKSDDSETSGKLKNMSNNVDKVIQKALENGTDDFDKRLGDYCSSVISDVNKCNKAIKSHKTNIKMYQEDTEKIRQTFNETRDLERKLNKSFFSSEGGNLDFLNNILKQEIGIDKRNDSKNNIKVNKDTKMKVQDKDKLLATLRAIDNGDSFETMNNNIAKSADLMKEIYGDVSDI